MSATKYNTVGLSYINLALRSTPRPGWMEKLASWVSLCPGLWLGSQSPSEQNQSRLCCALFCLHAHQTPSLSNVTQFRRHRGDAFLLLERCSFHPFNLTLLSTGIHRKHQRGLLVQSNKNRVFLQLGALLRLVWSKNVQPCVYMCTYGSHFNRELFNWEFRINVKDVPMQIWQWVQVCQLEF